MQGSDEDIYQALTHLPLGYAAFLKVWFSNSLYSIVAWAPTAKLLSGECHWTSLMKSQHGQHCCQTITWAKLTQTWWRHQMETFPALLTICAGNSPVPVNSPHKGQWRGALMFTLICARINGWVNNREAGDLRRYRAHYDVIVMSMSAYGVTRLLWGNSQ